MFLLLSVATFTLGGESLRQAVGSFGIDRIWEIPLALIGIDRQPIYTPLGFLRDLFVSILIVHMLMRMIPRYGLAIFAVMLGLALFQLTEPLIFRPTILLFLFSGALFASRGVRLSEMCQPRYVLPVCAAAVAGLFLVSGLSNGHLSVLAQVENLFLRIAMIGFVLLFTAALVRALPNAKPAAMRSPIFVTYLSHGIMIAVLTKIVRAAGLDPLSSEWILYYVALPAILIGFGLLFDLTIRRMPDILQMVLRGQTG
ncbi:hypothetical protein [Salipiger abyssi]|uniref:hypothetical protein n=1 Tax=Salipiger abyssi TaxID=1250539 RepID=UPI001F3A3631|nr:hypothetical protein [Salipiger abyssi]